MERVKRYANGQHDVHAPKWLAPGGGEHWVKGLSGEHVILEKGKQGQIGRDTGQQRQLSLPLSCALPRNDPSPNKIHARREQHQPDEPGLPPTVEDVTAEGYAEISPARRHSVIDQQKQGQE